jgi:hypothetical protein
MLRSRINASHSSERGAQQPPLLVDSSSPWPLLAAQRTTIYRIRREETQHASVAERGTVRSWNSEQRPSWAIHILQIAGHMRCERWRKWLSSARQVADHTL